MSYFAWFYDRDGKPMFDLPADYSIPDAVEHIQMPAMPERLSAAHYRPFDKVQELLRIKISLWTFELVWVNERVAVYREI